jgi:hypothetical protein
MRYGTLGRAVIDNVACSLGGGVVQLHCMPRESAVQPSTPFDHHQSSVSGSTSLHVCAGREWGQ